jgi:DNA polymerase-2
MQTTRKWMEELGYSVIYGDTDSIFVKVDESLTAQCCNEIGNELMTHINHQWERHIAKHFNLKSYLEIEFETHYSPFFMPTIRDKKTGSKKRYVGKIVKGDESKIVFKGMETVRSDWTEFAQEFQKELFEALFDSQFEIAQLDEIVKDYTKRLFAGEFDQKLVYKKRLGRNLNDYEKNIPPHVQAVKKHKAEHPDFEVRRGQIIEYVYAMSGAEIFNGKNALNYQLYLQRQLTPISNSIIDSIISSSEEKPINGQLSLINF